MISIQTTATRERFSRRALLRSLGASAAILPLLHSERARAAMDNGFPRRIVTIAWANGVALPNFYSQSDDPTEGSIMKPLAPLKSKVTVVAGLDYKIMTDAHHNADGHFGFPTMFTGTYKNLGGQNAGAAGPSLDQVVADTVAKQVNLPMPLLVASAVGGSNSYRAGGQRNTAETDPTRLYTSLFANKGVDSTQIDKLRARRASVLDYVSAQLKNFGTRLGAVDRAKVDGHLDSIRKLELELSAVSPVSCNGSAAPKASDYPGKVKAFNDLTALAMRCDLTRAANLVWAGDGGSQPSAMPFLNLGSVSLGAADGGSEVHAIAHKSAAAYAQKSVIDAWYMSQLAYLAKALDDVQEAGGTALDHSVIVMGNDMYEGAYHTSLGIPFVLVGNGGGFIRTGRTIKVGSWAGHTGAYYKSSGGGIAHNRLLASLAMAMGVPGENFGDPAYTGNLNTELKG
jgi:hypothetical protein